MSNGSRTTSTQRSSKKNQASSGASSSKQSKNAQAATGNGRVHFSDAANTVESPNDTNVDLEKLRGE